MVVVVVVEVLGLVGTVVGCGFVVGGGSVGGGVGVVLGGGGALTVKMACATTCGPAPTSHHACTSAGPGGASPGMLTMAERWSSVDPVWGLDCNDPTVTNQPATHWLYPSRQR